MRRFTIATLLALTVNCILWLLTPTPARAQQPASDPALVVRKSGPATMNLGAWGNFGIDVQNTGQSDAWNLSLRDVLPDGTTGGMCNLTPQILSAQVFAADGVTAVPGKGPLNQGSDYSLNYSATFSCQLDITILTAAGTIGPNQRLIVRYRTQLDPNTQNGATLTNIAAAIQWFNADNSVNGRNTYTGLLTDGTPGIPDNQDAVNVTVALAGYEFDKTVANLTSGADPATTAAPGDKLRYTLRFRTTSQGLSNLNILDEVDALNAQAAFVAGTLTLITFPAGADISATSSIGGTKRTGVVDIRNLSVPANSEALIQFDIILKPSIANGTVVSNQATLRLAIGTTFAWSDDPNVNGIANPTVANGEDPTRVTIASAPAFREQKLSTYVGNTNVLLAGNTLHYTIAVKNISNAGAVNVVLRDAVPANTTYVAGSTTLNGSAVADVAGMSPLANGMLINSPANPTPGSMPADTSNSQANTATITFNVVVNPNTPNGTLICNQSFVNASGSGIADQPSDDPRTSAASDPTCDMVGNRPVLYAQKRVALLVDGGSAGIVDPGDVLRYTITVQNLAAAASATGVGLKDPVPANTTYVPNSTLLNGVPVGQPDGGVSPLASGINISSSNLTPPLPGPGGGVISAGATAVLQYDLRVNPGAAVGAVISNQAVVSSAGQPNLLTDSSGNPANAPQPTVVMVSGTQQISISKGVAVVGNGRPIPGAQLDYLISIVNTGAVPAYSVVVTDDLNGSQPGQLAYVNGSALMNGLPAGISVSGSTITANYGAIYGALAPGAIVVMSFRVTINPSVTPGTVVINTAVANWNRPTQTTSAIAAITVVAPPPTPAVLNGSAWYDANFDNVQDSRERVLAGWVVELYQGNQLSQSVQTDANGVYRMTGVAPNNTPNAGSYELRFHAPGAGPNTAVLGRAVSPFTNGLQRISNIIVSSGANLEGLNLPIHPNGVIYDSIARTPVAAVTLTMLDARSGSPLPAGCFDDVAQQGQITLADGYYRFDINFSDAACPTGGDYLIGMTAPPGTNYVPGYSQVIPATSSTSTTAFSVPACPGNTSDALRSTTSFCEAQPSEFAPATSVPPRSAATTYYLRLRLDNSQMPGSSQIFNNHIPVDPVVPGAVTITKTASLVNVSRGQLVPYTITVNNHSTLPVTDLSIVDRMPAGFSYIKGSAILDGVPTEPSVAGTSLNWNGVRIGGMQVRTLKLLLAVSAGVNGGEFVNRAQLLNLATGSEMSGEATATVRLVPDSTLDCSDVTGKVYNDANRNGRQEDGEEGLPGVRVVTPTGLQATTDKYGRYHITCAIVPNDSRGSNFVLKLDDRTLPSGFRMTTDQVQVQRATSGKALQFNFGASIHRVVSIDLLDAAFEPGTTEIAAEWKPRVNVLVEELRKAPGVLRLSYVADTEDAALVKRRVEAFKRQLSEAWDPANSAVLTIEPEVFWRRGGPAKRSQVREPESRLVMTASSAGPSNTTAPFKTVKPAEQVERHLSSDRKLREWSLDENVPDDIKRIKVCRTEEVCKMRFREGETPRMRIRNLVVPLRYEDEDISISEAFTRQVRQALDDLQDKRGVTARFIGYTDNVPLTGRDQQTYGNQLSLSKAMAHRVAEAMREKLGLPASAIQSDGRGAINPVADNETVQGRVLNRRVEVEFWYDDPLQELSDEPQLCPGDASEIVTRVYEPRWGSIAPIALENGQPIIPPGYAANLRRALMDISDRTNARLRFIGYTKTERLNRRTASVYGDDVGLSAARARRAMESIMQDPMLSGGKAEHEGRGYVQSDDVVNTGFIEGPESFVRVQVVYDETLPLDNYEGVDITRLTQELRPKSPYDLNVMHIAVDGKPIDDPGRSSSNIQRCTDVALDDAKIRFGFDNLESRPRLAVGAYPVALGVSALEGRPAASVVRFRMYNNYSSFIERAEIRIFEPQHSLQDDPLEVIAADEAGLAVWLPTEKILAGPERELKYLLRVYDSKGHIDETEARPLLLYGEQSSGQTGKASTKDDPPELLARELLSAYGENNLARHQIPLGSGTVTLQGSGIPQGHTVWLGGRQIPIDPKGNFAAEQILPDGTHTVEVAVLDDAGNGTLYLRDLEFDRRDVFYVGVADLTVSQNGTAGPIDLFQGQNSRKLSDSSLDGRLAFYVNGKVSERWRLTASADTREGPVKTLFNNFLDKSPDSLFRRINPEYYYPTFGDDGVVTEMAPTLGKFYLKASHGENYGMWGNFNTGYMGNELAHVDRGLYGGNLHYGSDSTTRFGERRFSMDGFAAQPGTLASYQEFRGTGGSLYFLRHQDILTGSERVRIEIRDKDSHIVVGVVNLQPNVDYDIDYLQGRLLLTHPLSSTADDNMLVHSSGLSGNEAWLVARYEYTPGFTQLNALSSGGQTHFWLSNHIQLGLTANNNKEGDAKSNLGAADMTLRMSAKSFLKVQAGQSKGLLSSTIQSNDGGFGFQTPGDLSTTDLKAGAYRADLSIGLGDFFKSRDGVFTFYKQDMDAGYSAPGQMTIKDTEQYGGTLKMPVTNRLSLAAKGDQRIEVQGLQTRAAELNMAYKLTERWSVSTGVRNDLRNDRSPVVPLTQEQGERTDAVAQVMFVPGSTWRTYGFVQDTVAARGGRESNSRIGAGGSYRLTKRFRIDGEASDGDLGPGGKVGTTFLYSDWTNLYLNYSLDNERAYTGTQVRQGNLISGVKTRLSDSSSVYAEQRYQNGASAGLTRTTGINLVAKERWNFGGSTEIGTLRDSLTGAATDRKAAGIRMGYGREKMQFSSGIEFRRDNAEQLDLTQTKTTTWLFRNNFKVQLTPSWRMIGKLDHSMSDSSLGAFYAGGYTEGVLAYAYRPVRHDRLNVLAKYTYFYNVPTTEQVTIQNSAVEFIQKSHIAALDLSYDLTANWSLGGKYAYRLGQASLDRSQLKFFANTAQLAVIRVDRRFWKNWDAMAEVRMLALPDIQQRRRGALTTIYRRLGANLKVGVGYNFTDFSDDLTDLRYNHRGVFVNLIGIK